VPEIAQVVWFKLRPVGSAGVATQLVMAPPVLVGVWVVMAEFLVPVRVLGLNEITGMMSFTVIVTVSESLPDSPVAVIV
jgi:hypothetical protein